MNKQNIQAEAGRTDTENDRLLARRLAVPVTGEALSELTSADYMTTGGCTGFVDAEEP